MDLKNAPERYGLLHKFIHWITAALIMGLLWIGAGMAGMGASPTKIQLVLLHKSFGLLVLFIVVLRILWKLTNPRVEALQTHKPWEKTLAKIAHLALYALMIAMPLSGWFMSSAADFPAPFFGLFEMPHIIPKDRELSRFFRESHELLAYAIIGVVALHAAGAFKHHFIDKDETLRRMTARRAGFVTGVVLALLTAILLAMPLFINWVYEQQEEARAAQPAAVQAQVIVQDEILPPGAAATEGTSPADDQTQKAPFPHQWVINHDDSSISFEATQYGQAFSGSFNSYAATIVFDPDDLAASKALVSIDIAGISTGSDDRDDQARSADWFDAAQFPQAVFESESFEQTGPNQYVAKGNLTIRGVTMPVELPFSLTIEPGADGYQTAHMQAQITLNRLDFGIGQGQWQATDSIGNPVKITISLHAARSMEGAE